MTIAELLPDPDALLALEPEELAGILLQYLAALPENDGQLNRYNFSLPHTLQGYPPAYHARVGEALMEAWVWLEREGLLAPKPGAQGNWVFVTRRGRQAASPEALKAYRHGLLLPKRVLQPPIAQKVWATFLRGDYDTAVFQAFKEVEVTVRDAGGYPPEDIGVPLMRKAFAAGSGPLTDHKAPVAEQEALAHLFAGAIGSYKNPHSHRNVAIGPEEAFEMIVLASHLLGIVGQRRRQTGGTA